MKWISLFIAVWLVLAGKAQSYSISYTYDANIQPRSLGLKTKLTDSAAARAYIENIPSVLLAKGYLAASVDKVFYDSSSASVSLYLGTQYHWGEVIIQENYQAILGRLATGKRFSGKVISGGAVAQWQEELLDYFANNGHPFASVGLDSVTVTGNALSGKMVINEGPLYKIDSIHLAGNVKLRPNFIYPYLHIEKGMPYNQEVLDGIDKRINELLFAEPIQPWQLDMLGSGSIVNVALKPRRSNIINALIGLAPASTQTPNNKLLLSGEVNLLLRNAFANGETVGINWQQLQYKSPRLNLLFQQPYLFGSQAGVDFAFDLFKKDTQYLNINFRIGVPYDFTGSRRGKVFFQLSTTNVTYIDTNQVKATRRLPDLANSASNSLGLEYEWNTTNYRLNPRRGAELFVSGIGGLKRIKQNNTITQLKDPQQPDYSFASLYDTVKMKTYQVRLQAQAAKYLPMGQQTVFKIGLNGGFYQSQNYYRNELFQIGGHKLLRGFDEESIFARSYLIGTAEFRFITGRNSYFFAFSDGGYAGYKDEVSSYGHSYIGAGLGLALETKNSVINLSWAVGKRNDLPLELRQSKIHIGFVNYF